MSAPNARRNTAIASVVGALLWVALPSILLRTGLPDRSSLYKGLPVSRGPAAGSVERSIFEDRGDSDIVFVGSSTVYGAIRFPDVQAKFQERFRRPSIIKVLAMHDCGPDMQYVMLSDYLKRHNTKVVALAMPWRSGYVDGPSSGLSGLLRYGEMPDVTAGLGKQTLAKIYAEQVLASPRQLLNRMRPNRLVPGEDTDKYRNEQVQAQRLNVGYLNAKFEPLKFGNGFDPSGSAAFTTSSKDFQLVPNSIKATGYTANFYRKIQALCQARHARLILLHLPEIADQASETIPTILPLAEIFGPNVNVVAIRPKLFYKFAPGAEFKKLFYDDIHLNQNGATIYQNFAINLVFDEFAFSLPGK